MTGNGAQTLFRICECGRFQGDMHIIIYFRGKRIGEYLCSDEAIGSMLSSIDRNDLTDEETQLFTRAGHAALTCLPLIPEQAGDTEALEWAREVFMDKHPRLKDMLTQMFSAAIEKCRENDAFSFITHTKSATESLPSVSDTTNRD